MGELLGEGGYSKVYLGISKTALRQKVAIKIISRSNLQKEDEVEDKLPLLSDSF
jgi:serine/threonine protein kinase